MFARGTLYYFYIYNAQWCVLNQKPRGCIGAISEKYKVFIFIEMFEQALSVSVPNPRLCNSDKLTRATQCRFSVVSATPSKLCLPLGPKAYKK